MRRREWMMRAGAMCTLSASGVLARAAAHAAQDDRILVVLELSGGNDGLNTIVPWADDRYYALRPQIGLQRQTLLPLDDHFGFNPGLLGFERLWRDGKLAIVHGCGYAQPSFSHFTSMAYWHTAAPNSGDEYGWCGRLVDNLEPTPRPNLLINIDTTQSLAVKSSTHTPVVFDEPERFQRRGLAGERALLDHVANVPGGNPSLDFLNAVATSARESSAVVRAAWTQYRTPIDYGLVDVQLPKVAACIAAGLPTRVFYLAYRNNAFDTHVQQPELHQRLLSYVGDAVHGFQRDLTRLGVADRVSTLIFSEFGRRAPENTNRGTDHGTANIMFLVGNKVRGGHHGEPSRLDALDAGDNLVYTTDFRRVYASVIDRWLAPGLAARVLKGEFAPLALFA
jgi:uncharacterized protein (DUF1501 family)